jgi:polyprenyl-phospho-N-acetylgalactosaminyl synthase
MTEPNSAEAFALSRSVWVVVPAYNEEIVIRGVLKELRELGYSVVAVDDGSTDKTSQEIRKVEGVVCCSHVLNLGQGAAIQTGISFALRQGAGYIVLFDADGQHQAGEIERLLEPLRLGHYDVVLGSRFADGGVAVDIPALKRTALILAVYFTRLITGLKVTDTHNGFKAFTAHAAGSFTICHNGMTHASEILSLIAQRRFRFCEVPVTIHYTPYSLAKGQRLSNIFNILWELFTGGLAR